MFSSFRLENRMSEFRNIAKVATGFWNLNKKIEFLLELKGSPFFRKSSVEILSQQAHVGEELAHSLPLSIATVIYGDLFELLKLYHWFLIST